MCWITLSPKGRKHDHHHHPHLHHPHLHHHEHHDDKSSIEHLVRRDRVSFDRVSFDIPAPSSVHSSHHHNDSARVRIITPTLPVLPEAHRHHHHRFHIHAHDHEHDHHHHHHMHPLHLHPVKLHGPGKKRAPLPKPFPKPPPPSECPPPGRSPSRDPIYRIQPIYERREPQVREVRETTRIALREARPQRERLRRVAGYEVLGKRMPWSWDCVSSTLGSSVR